MAGVRNLTQLEAIERARLLEVTSYDITLDLTDGTGGPGEGTFRSVTEVRFRCAEPGASTFIEVAATALRSARLNGADIDTSAWSAETGLALPDVAAQNVLVVDGDFPYSTSGQGVHRIFDPVDKQVYLYSQFETSDAQKAYACFDQPDLKSVFTWHATVPGHWKVISNSVVEFVTPGDVEGTKVVHFVPSVKMSTYITALCAGPYHEVRQLHDGIDLGLFVRDSMKQHLDADELFLITRQGFDFFHEQFGVRYPLPKYDQLFVPEFNAGAMENFGCIVHAESRYIFRSHVTEYRREERSNTVLHEMAHMWFGDLVTMRWWDDIWLNESFAEWASHWADTTATRFKDAWTTFLAIRKAWGYRQDQLPSTHPVYCEMPDVEAVEVNFDGITYAKGASVIKQLVAYVGVQAFLEGLRAYFAAHAWGNATFDDLLTNLERASGRELRAFAAEWLETAQVNVLRPELEFDADGRYARVTVVQEAPADHPTLRTHRIGVGLYDLVGDRLVLRDRLEVDVAGARTDLPALTGVRAPDVLLLNDDDLTYAKLRLDERSMATVVEHISGFESSLARGLCWAAAWDMLRDGELAGRDYVRLVCAGLPHESEVNLVSSTLPQVHGACQYYVDAAWISTATAMVSDTGRKVLATAEPGGSLQLAWAGACIQTARTDEELTTLQSWLDGVGVPKGLRIDTDMRWSIVSALVATGRAGEAEIDAEYDRDRTASGELSAATARALIPTAEAKAEAWRKITGPVPPNNSVQRAVLAGFYHPEQLELTEPYVAQFLGVLDTIWSTRDSEVAQDFVKFGFPTPHISQPTYDAVAAWLTGEHAAGLRKMVVEGHDTTARGLRSRAKDRGAA